MSTLVLKDFSGVPEITEEAYALRNRALKLAQTIFRVTNEIEQSAAVLALQELKTLRVGIEQSRKLVKAPVIDLGKRIDAIASDFLSEPVKLEGKLGGMINHFQKEGLKKQREAQEQLEREAKEAERLRELAAKEANPEKKQELEQQAFDKQMDTEVAMPLAVAKSKGLIVKERRNFKITDPIAFVHAYPKHWKWHPDTETLKLRRIDLLDELNREKPVMVSTGVATGIEVFSETRSHVR
jgi:hypothetical protein